MSNKLLTCTPSLCCQLSSLLHAAALFPFPISGLNGLGVTLGHMAPSFLPRFSRSSSHIFPYEVNKCCSIARTVKCPKHVNYSTSGDKKTGFTALTILFFNDSYTAVYLLKID